MSSGCGAAPARRRGGRGARLKSEHLRNGTHPVCSRAATTSRVSHAPLRAFPRRPPASATSALLRYTQHMSTNAAREAAEGTQTRESHNGGVDLVRIARQHTVQQSTSTSSTCDAMGTTWTVEQARRRVYDTQRRPRRPSHRRESHKVHDSMTRRLDRRPKATPEDDRRAALGLPLVASGVRRFPPAP